MISFWISVVPPKIAIAGVGSVGCRVGGGFLPVAKKIWPGDRVLSRAVLTRSLAGKPVSPGRNGREPFRHSSRYDWQVERPYSWRPDDGAVSLQES